VFIDFPAQWHAITPRQWAHAASEVMDTVDRELGINLPEVLVTTDEKDEDWRYVPFVATLV
jgi:hypothetical protein